MGYHKKHRQMLADLYYTETVAKLRQAREDLGLSQRVVAHALDVTWETVSAWERYKTIPSIYHFFEWCKALSITFQPPKPTVCICKFPVPLQDLTCPIHGVEAQKCADDDRP